MTNKETLKQRALKVFPGGANTASKYINRRNKYPIITSGNGSIIFDTNRNSYIDWTAGLGAVILGYRKQKYIDYGNLFSSVTEEEIILAEKLIEIVPCAEQVRFFKTGSECTSAAVRLARAINKDPMILCCGYHGWHDWYVKTLPFDKRLGITDIYNTDTIEYDDIEDLEAYINMYGPSALIIEPVNRDKPDKANVKHLKEVRELCTKYNVLLIFDEIISGFRYDIGGISTLWDIEPDLACYSKAMANGYPIAALVGKEKYMKVLEYIHVSGTFNGERISIANALRTIKTIEEENVCDKITKIGFELRFNISCMIEQYDFIEVKGFQSWFRFVWKDEEKKRRFYDYVLSNGIYSMDDHFVMADHSEYDVEKTLGVYEKGFEICQKLRAQ